MSKKKAFSGSTMTLKDFHGGSIPSDLPLPSAPGVIVRPSDRSPFDRQIPTPPWGSGSIARSDHRSRPGSSGPTRTFDEKASFLSVSHIGRNFDEDERKPFDGGVTRRPASDDSVRAPSIARPDPKPVAAKQVSTAPVVHSQPPAAVKLAAGPNAWASRREAAEPALPAAAAAAAGTASAWSGPSAVSKFAQASAVEKISSGRWQSKPAQVYHQPPDVEVIRFVEVETETETHVRFGNSQMDGRIELDVARGKYGDRDMSPKYPEAKERSPAFYSDEARPASTEGKLGGGSQSQVATEAERPKLKLLPRTKPMEPSEAHVVDYNKQGYQPPVADSGHVESVNEFFGNVNPPKPGSAGGDGANRAVERPKLNLKPRTQSHSQPRSQPAGSVERERNTLFGGARPRELVLKERGVDDVVINNLDMSQPTNRAKHDSPKPDSKPEPSLPNTRYGERPENFQPDQRTGRDFERKDHRPDTEKTDTQRSSWRNDNRRNVKEIEKPQERRPEPESWRKPIESPKQPTSEAPGPRFGRATSALELAQAFSRSMSDAKSTDRFTSQRSLPGRNQVPFSRLTDTREFYSGPTTRQINGY